MKLLSTLTIIICFIAACAPKDRFLKGSKNNPESENKIKESAYFGSSFEVSTYATYRLLEAKRIMDIALRWQTLDVSKDSKASGFDNNPGFELLKSCWGGKNDVYIDVLVNQPKQIEFVLDFDNCTSIGSFAISTKVYGKEHFKINFTTATVDGKLVRALSRIEYNTINFHHVFKANSKHPRFSQSSYTDLFEDRKLTITRRDGGKFFFIYSADGDFNQNLVGRTLRALEPRGRHSYYADGNFEVEKSRAVKVKMGKVELIHSADREVLLTGGSKRSLFTNDNNKLNFLASIGEVGINFDKECSFIEGEIYDVDFENSNKNRNQFFQKLDGASTSTIDFSAEYNKGRDPEKVLLNGVKGYSVTTKCLLKSTNLKTLAQPKSPFDLIFMR